MDVYYNENGPYVAEWLRNLIVAGEIPPGEVDERSIQDIDPGDLEGYGQVHFFAGIGGWPLALRLAGWPNDCEVWTGSCPCQPFSSAGQRKGHADERHLWPAFYALIAECRPPTILGEQVASKDGREWLAGVRADLEGLGYAVGAADLPAAGVGAPQIRQRLWWVGIANGTGSQSGRQAAEAVGHRHTVVATGGNGGMADASGQRRQQERRGAQGDESKDGRRQDGGNEPSGDGPDGRLARADGGDVSAEGLQRGGQHRPSEPSAVGGLDDAPGPRRPGQEQPGEINAARNKTRMPKPERRGGAGFWADFDLIPCADGKSRRVEPGTFPLAHGVPNRVGRLRAYGNAIVPPQAAEFVRAVMEALDGQGGLPYVDAG